MKACWLLYFLTRPVLNITVNKIDIYRVRYHYFTWSHHSCLVIDGILLVELLVKFRLMNISVKLESKSSYNIGRVLQTKATIGSCNDLLPGSIKPSHDPMFTTGRCPFTAYALVLSFNKALRSIDDYKAIHDVLLLFNSTRPNDVNMHH